MANLRTSICRGKKWQFLGFLLNTQKFIIELPQEKKLKIRILLDKIQPGKKYKIREFARLIGTLISACPAVKYGWLYTKRLEQEKYKALEKCRHNYDEVMVISNYVLPDLQWWRKNIYISFNNILQDNYEMEIFTDASETGWGACANGQRFHGWWEKEDRSYHINFLELKAIFLGLQCLANRHKNCNILIRSDNKTAISYINRMGSIRYPELSFLSRDIWQWCEQRRLWLFASYIRSSDNWEADKESRMLKPETEWALAHYAFSEILVHFGKPEFDLFASQFNKKCKRYASWKVDQGAEVIDAFTFFWGDIYFYAFPPVCLILRTIKKIIDDQASGILVVPNWDTQPWFPLFSKIITKKPLVFPPKNNLLSLPYRKQHHPLSAKLSLVAASVSGKLLN